MGGRGPRNYQLEFAGNLYHDTDSGFWGRDLYTIQSQEHLKGFTIAILML